ncbi:MAG: hypothetical protein J5483_00725 [Lachnospiraceae bacterium]|nr:hypothetical protein [Lachnospiraceae bacterium]
MTFQEFVEYAKNNIKDYLPDTFRNDEPEVRVMNKLNSSYTGLTLRPTTRGNVAVACADLDMFYQSLDEGLSLEEAMSEMAKAIMTPAMDISMEIYSNYETAKDRLFVRVGNAAASQGILGNAPHRLIGDISVTYHLLIDENEEGLGSSTVTNELLEKYGVSEERLYEDAVQNSQRLFPPTISCMDDEFMYSVLTGIPRAYEEFDKSLPEVSFDRAQMLVLSNKQSMFGAAVMLYPDLLEKVAEQTGEDFYILPSSVHEVLLLQKNSDYSPVQLQEMVESINNTSVDPKDVLSNNVYQYVSLVREIDMIEPEWELEEEFEL